MTFEVLSGIALLLQLPELFQVVLYPVHVVTSGMMIVTKHPLLPLVRELSLYRYFVALTL